MELTVQWRDHRDHRVQQATMVPIVPLLDRRVPQDRKALLVPKAPQVVMRL
jgi:hypothetical protein